MLKNHVKIGSLQYFALQPLKLPPPFLFVYQKCFLRPSLMPNLCQIRYPMVMMGHRRVRGPNRGQKQNTKPLSYFYKKNWRATKSYYFNFVHGISNESINVIRILYITKDRILYITIYRILYITKYRILYITKNRTSYITKYKIFVI